MQVMSFILLEFKKCEKLYSICFIYILFNCCDNIEMNHSPFSNFLFFLHVWQQEALNVIVKILSKKQYIKILCFWHFMHLQLSRHFFCVADIFKSYFWNENHKFVILCHFSLNNIIAFNLIVITRQWEKFIADKENAACDKNSID